MFFIFSFSLSLYTVKRLCLRLAGVIYAMVMPCLGCEFLSVLQKALIGSNLVTAYGCVFNVFPRSSTDHAFYTILCSSSEYGVILSFHKFYPQSGSKTKALCHKLHMPPRWCCAPQTGPAFRLGRSPSPHSRTLACSHTAVRCHVESGLHCIFFVGNFVLIIEVKKIANRL